MNSYPDIGICVPEILIPCNSIDLNKWSVVACDQFTSEPHYWEQVEKTVGQLPSTYRLILPEAYLGTEKEFIHQKSIPIQMREYLNNGILDPINGFIYVERFFDGIQRNGLVATIDLESYNFQRDSQSLIRATEGTILERIPPRVKVRQEALLEIPHIMVLIDDPEKIVIEPIQQHLQTLPQLYNFELMQGGGSIRGFQVNSKKVISQIIIGLRHLASESVQIQKYGGNVEQHPLLFAVGDGNHSLATAKTVWQGIKSHVGKDHPARYALVEIINIHDSGIVFEPIHRLIRNYTIDIIPDLKKYFKNQVQIQDFRDFDKMSQAVFNNSDENNQAFGIFSKGIFKVITLTKPQHTLIVGNVQNFLDELTKIQKQITIDYIHGHKSIYSLGTQENNAGIFLPAMNKNLLFKSVINDGTLPRKTFSMGEAHQKRYYLESRLIQEWKYDQ